MLEDDMPSARNKILRTLTDCAIRMPEKCTIYSTIVGLLNAKNYNFGGEVRHLSSVGVLFFFEIFNHNFIYSLLNIW